MKSYRVFNIWDTVRANGKRKAPKKLDLVALDKNWQKGTGHSVALLKKTVAEMVTRGLLVEHPDTGYALPDKL